MLLLAGKLLLLLLLLLLVVVLPFMPLAAGSLSALLLLSLLLLDSAIESRRACNNTKPCVCQGSMLANRLMPAAKPLYLQQRDKIQPLTL